MQRLREKSDGDAVTIRSGAVGETNALNLADEYFHTNGEFSMPQDDQALLSQLLGHSVYDGY